MLCALCFAQFVTLHRTDKDGGKTDAYWGLEKYSGGRDGSAKNFPTPDAPLVIPASSFFVSFKSDGRQVASTFGRV